MVVNRQSPRRPVELGDYAAIAMLACARHNLRLSVKEEELECRAHCYVARAYPSLHEAESRGAEVLKIKRLGRDNRWGVEEALINRRIAELGGAEPHAIAAFLGSDEVDSPDHPGELYLVMRFRAYPMVRKR